MLPVCYAMMVFLQKPSKAHKGSGCSQLSRSIGFAEVAIYASL